MSPAAITVEGLGKRYRIGSRPSAYRTLGEAITQRLRRSRREQEDRDLWALEDVSFEVQRGEAVGILGANGAGKTTLLKILSRVTEPTTGRAVVRGRVGSLLEVGTGFHPELTGRENVYLNGAILGMRRAEIAAKFDEIVEFAEVERFVDTPVKRYSSGMYVRLAFAVAAHLDVDNLFVDEVLSVGDVGFQRKSLGKMQGQTSQEGRTVLFVSHNLASIKMLTERCIWLDHGHVRAIGPTAEIFREYVLSHGGEGSGGTADLTDMSVGRLSSATLEARIVFESVEVRGSDGVPRGTYLEGDPVSVRVGLRALAHIREPEFEVRCRLRTIEGAVVFAVLDEKREVDLAPGRYETGFTIDPNSLRPGSYQLELYTLTRVAQDLLPAAITFRVEPNARPGDDSRHSGALDLGFFRVEYKWDTLSPVPPA